MAMEKQYKITKIVQTWSVFFVGINWDPSTWSWDFSREQGITLLFLSRNDFVTEDRDTGVVALGGTEFRTWFRMEVRGHVLFGFLNGPLYHPDVLRTG